MRHTFVLLVMLVGCRPVGPPQASDTSAAANTPAPPPPAQPTRERQDLGGRLADEASVRAAGTPRPEDTLAALAAHGLPLAGWKQVLGATVRAGYCMAGHTPSGLGVAVCEYADEASAEEGIAFSRQTFDRLIPQRRLARNRKTVLTLTPAPGEAATHADAERAATVFASL
jgi:hypothetical protein